MPLHSPAPAHLLDVTRSVRRAGRLPTGIDRIERAYLAQLIRDPAPLFGLLRTKLGFVLLDRDGCAAVLHHGKAPIWARRDLLSVLMRVTDNGRAIAETGLRRLAIDRALPMGLGGMLRRHLPRGAVYFNVGQSSATAGVLHRLRDTTDMRVAVYVHDTIPLDWPEHQTDAARRRFKAFFASVEQNADLVLCNSEATRACILTHARGAISDRVHVIWPGLPDMTPGHAPRGPWTGQPYFMTIGTIEPRKNIGFLLDLWQGYTGQTDPHLLLCGQRGWGSSEVLARLDAAPANVHEVSDLPDAEMWALLSQSRGLLFPSVAEGFGYPAFEAAQLNVPVVCAPLPVFQEALGDVPHYAALTDHGAWSASIAALAGMGADRPAARRPASLPTWQAHFNQLFTAL